MQENRLLARGTCGPPWIQGCHAPKVRIGGTHHFIARTRSSICHGSSRNRLTPRPAPFSSCLAPPAPAGRRNPGVTPDRSASVAGRQGVAAIVREERGQPGHRFAPGSIENSIATCQRLSRAAPGGAIHESRYRASRRWGFHRSAAVLSRGAGCGCRVPLDGCQAFADRVMASASSDNSLITCSNDGQEEESASHAELGGPSDRCRRARRKASGRVGA